MAGRSDSERTFEAQRYLRALHFDAAAPEIPLINPDGIYGAETRDAVREFQRTHGLPVTGEIDYQTWTALSGRARLRDDTGRELGYRRDNTVHPAHPRA